MWAFLRRDSKVHFRSTTRDHISKVRGDEAMRKLILTHGRRLHKNSAEWHKLIATLLLILTTLRRQITHHVRYGNGSTVTSEYITLWCCWLAIIKCSFWNIIRCVINIWGHCAEINCNLNGCYSIYSNKMLNLALILLIFCDFLLSDSCDVSCG